MPADRPTARVNDLLFRAVQIAFPVAIFLWFFHPQILIPTNIGWLLQGDPGAGAIGWNAFRHDAWRWPLGETRLLDWPQGATVTFTDANPLLSLLLKPFSPLLPEPFQFTGVWLLSCILGQAFAAYALLGHATSDRWLRLLGATLLTLAPTLLNRMSHANLCAHWTILLSLHLFLNVRREGRRDLGFGALLTVSALVHPYFLLMNGAVWSSDLLRRAYGALRRRGARGLAMLAARAAAVAFVPVAALWGIGGLGGYEPDIFGFGFYSMPLDALFNPGEAQFSRLLPTAPLGQGQVYEGFQYLGAGLLFLIAVAVGALAWPAARARLRSMGWLLWLTPALLALTALALSDHVQLHGRTVVSVGYDWLPFHLTSAFRASGRLFWPCAYVLVLAALELVFSLPRTVAMVLALAALALQVVDLPGFAAAVRDRNPAQVLRWTRTPSPAWDALVASAEAVEFEPPEPLLDGALFYEIAWRATTLKRPVNVMYTARVREGQAAVQAADRARFLGGQVDPARLYVVLRGCLPPGLDPARLRLLDGVVVIPPAKAGLALPPAPAPEPLRVGTTVSAGAPTFRCMLLRDWSGVEDWGVWSDGGAPELVLPLAAMPAGDLRLTVRARPFPAEGQGVSVVVGGRTLARWSLVGPGADYTVRIPRALIAGRALRVTLKVDQPTAPSAGGGSQDTRALGIGLTGVRLDAAVSDAPP